jgi:hypothetical protein
LTVIIDVRKIRNRRGQKLLNVRLVIGGMFPLSLGLSEFNVIRFFLNNTGG